MTWPGKGKCDMWVGGGGCHALGWVPWRGVDAMEQGSMDQGWCHATGQCCGQYEGPFRACCIIQCSPSQERLAHSPALSTWPHPAPTGLAGCLSSHWGSLGYPEWGLLDSRFPSHLTLCLWADDVPPPPAPFAHRTVTLRSANVSSQFSLSSKDILGG